MNQGLPQCGVSTDRGAISRNTHSNCKRRSTRTAALSVLCSNSVVALMPRLFLLKAAASAATSP
jgi:hypothetical protein